MNAKETVTRHDFLTKFVSAGGLKYEEAAKIYDAMVSLFADAVVTGKKVSIGRVLAIKPIRKKPRKVHMGFGSVKKTIFLSERLVFKTVVHREFLKSHSLEWGI